MTELGSQNPVRGYLLLPLRSRYVEPIEDHGDDCRTGPRDKSIHGSVLAKGVDG
jgi:hypothetical protein